MARIVEVPNLDDLIERYRSGVSLKRISDESGIVRPTLIRKFKKCGVEIRGRSDAERLKWSAIKSDRGRVERQCGSAWAACRGREHSLTEKMQRARTRYRRLTHVGKWESDVADALRRKGFVVEQQFPEGPYNLDIAIRAKRIAVEIESTNHHTAHGSRKRERLVYLLDRGWSLLIVFSPYPARRSFDVAAVTNKVLAFAKLVGRDKSRCGHYGVVGSDGEPTTTTSYDLDGRPRVVGF